MSRRQSVIFALGLVAVVAFLLAVILPGSSKERSADPSTYSVHPSGCKALYVVLKELQLPVGRLRTSYTRLKGERGVLMAVAAQKLRYSRREIAKLKEWIRNGNRLVLFLGLGTRSLESDDEASAVKDSEPGERHVTTRGLFRSFGLKLKAVRNRARETVPVSMPDIGWSGMISVSDQARWMEPSADWQVLCKDQHGAVMLLRQMGKGEIFAVSDPEFPSNRNLAREQNLRFVLALVLGNGAPREILFDEYHHGHVLSDSLAGYVGSSVFAWVFLQVIIAAVLIFYSRRATHAGRFVPLDAQKGRSSLEYVQSIANIFESCKASSAVLEAILIWQEGKLARKTGVQVSGAVMSADIPTLEGEEVAHLQAECRHAVRGPDDPDRALVLAQKLAAVRSRIDRIRQAELRPVRRATR